MNGRPAGRPSDHKGVRHGCATGNDAAAGSVRHRGGGDGGGGRCRRRSPAPATSRRTRSASRPRPRPTRRRASRRCAATGCGTGPSRRARRCSPATAWSRPASRWPRRSACRSSTNGGNAADAAVATAAMLGVVEPHSAGIGGDMEAIYYSAKDHKLYGLNAAGWAPASATPEFYHQHGYNHVPFYGVFSATVPGAVDGWSRFLEALRAHVAGPGPPAVDRDRAAGVRADRADPGRLAELRQLLRPQAAPGPRVEQGVPARRARCRAVYSIFRNPHLARAYELLAKDGPDAFYRGPIGRAIVQAHERRRRGVEAVRPELVQVGMGRPDHHQLQGLRRLPDAAPDAGLRHAGDAEHPPGVRARRWATTCARWVRARRSSGASWCRPSGSRTRIC